MLHYVRLDNHFPWLPLPELIACGASRNEVELETSTERVRDLAKGRQ
jgi:hypothetical protein